MHGSSWHRLGVYLLQERHLLQGYARKVPDRSRVRGGRPGLLRISKKLPLGMGRAVGESVWSFLVGFFHVVPCFCFGLQDLYPGQPRLFL